LSGTLLEFRVSGDCNVAIAANAARGGVVLEDPDIAADANFGGCVVITEEPPCFPECHPDYATWVSLGSPTQWCNPRQCYGDADAAEEQIGKPWFWVGYNDLDALIDGFATEYSDPDASPWIAADFDHDEEQIGKPWFRVGYNDLNTLIANFASEVSADCLDCP
jgi:hypothetical protein